MIRPAALLGCIAMLPAGAMPQDPGIPVALARARRAQLESVAYALEFDLRPGDARVRGTVELQFRLRDGADGDVIVDCAVDELGPVTLNGAEVALRHEPGRLLLPRAALGEGINTLRASFASRAAATGTPLTRYEDPADGRCYLYTLLVPADAHRLFPCFDQPDLKARFTLALSLPAGWQAVANAAEVAAEPLEGERVRRRFAPTQPLSTYLFAFAAGPFTVVTPPDAPLPMRILVRDGRRAQLEAERIASMHVRALDWLAEYFGLAYPFGKLDLVLCPGFPYGGMEHAGAIFYRESALVFDHEPTAGEQVRRSTLIYHEVSHQWFGNLVTMEWFDDLWLKEGFATFVGFKLLQVLEPGREAWLRFLQRVKPAAYRVDATAGTTPIWQELQNLADAKSAYGAIVYNKAPAVLRELEQRLGEATFRDGVQRFLRRHAFGNARWPDLVAALEAAREAPGSTARWSERWILGSGMPRVAADWRVEQGRVAELTLRQRGVQQPDAIWPLRIALQAWFADGTTRQVTVALDQALARVPGLEGGPAPVALLPNADDVAYAQVVLDRRSFTWLARNAGSIEPALTRMAALVALVETVREAEAPPQELADALLRRLDVERDAETRAWLLDALATCIERWLEPDVAAALRLGASGRLLAQLRDGIPGLALDTFRFLAVHGAGEDVRALMRACADGQPGVPDLELGARDRFVALAALVAAGVDEGRLAASADWPERADPDFAKYRYLVQAAVPERDAKQRMFASFLDPGGTPEQWIQESLAFFHWPGQSALTLPFLRPALDRIDWVKQHRRIFFMPAWLDAFVGGHSSAEALAIVQEFRASRPDLTEDLRRKLLQSLDGLERAVRIRARWRR